MYEFDGDTWKYNALMDYVAFKELHEFVSNEVATEAHASSYEVIGDVKAFSEAQLDKLRTDKIDTMNKAKQRGHKTKGSSLDITHFPNPSFHLTAQKRRGS